MPKPFSMTIDVEETAVGPIFRLLNRQPGVISVHIDLDNNRPKLNGSGGERKPRKMGKDAPRTKLYAAMAKGKPVTMDHIKAALHGVGGPTTIRNTVYNSERQGFIKQSPKGHYALTEKGKRRYSEIKGE
jgi:hypothetical protein